MTACWSATADRVYRRLCAGCIYGLGGRRAYQGGYSSFFPGPGRLEWAFLLLLSRSWEARMDLSFLLSRSWEARMDPFLSFYGPGRLEWTLSSLFLRSWEARMALFLPYSRSWKARMDPVCSTFMP